MNIEVFSLILFLKIFGRINFGFNIISEQVANKSIQAGFLFENKLASMLVYLIGQSTHKTK